MSNHNKDQLLVSFRCKAAEVLSGCKVVDANWRLPPFSDACALRQLALIAYNRLTLSEPDQEDAPTTVHASTSRTSTDQAFNTGQY